MADLAKEVSEKWGSTEHEVNISSLTTWMQVVHVCNY